MYSQLKNNITMATIKELLSSYKVNEPITDKRILYHFKNLVIFGTILNGDI